MYDSVKNQLVAIVNMMFFHNVNSVIDRSKGRF